MRIKSYIFLTIEIKIKIIKTLNMLLSTAIKKNIKIAIKLEIAVEEDHKNPPYHVIYYR